MARRLFATIHPALLNTDIVSVICQSLNPKSLAALAGTAKFLLDPALNELWREIKYFSWILYPFRSSFEITKDSLDYPDMPTPMQWERFNFYARRIRILHIMCIFNTEISFLLLSPQRPLLPCLRSLVVPRWTKYELLYTLSIFFSPSLRKFSICYEDDMSLMDPLTTTLAITAPALQHFKLRIEDKHKFGRSVLHFHNLSSIDIPLAGLHAHAVLAHLSTLPSLSKVRLDTSLSGGISVTGSIYTFHAVQHLTIESESDTQATDLMTITRFENLTDLKICSCCYDKGGYSLFQAISLCCGQSLNHIDITDEGFCRNFPGRTVFTLHPLFKFTHLRYLSIINLLSSYPGDEDIKAITKSWPNIESFHMCSHQYQDGHFSTLTLTGLLLLIKECAGLVNLSIAVDARQPLGPNVDIPVSRMGFIKICHDYSRIDCPVVLANLLSSVLSDIRIDIEGYSRGGSYNLWKKVASLRPHFVRARQEARREERERAVKQVEELQRAFNESCSENTRSRACQT